MHDSLDDRPNLADLHWSKWDAPSIGHDMPDDLSHSEQYLVANAAGGWRSTSEPAPTTAPHEGEQ